MHGLIFETSIWLLAGSTRFLSTTTRRSRGLRRLMRVIKRSWLQSKLLSTRRSLRSQNLLSQTDEDNRVDCDFLPKHSKTANTTPWPYSAPWISPQCLRFETDLRQAYQYKLPNRPRNRQTASNCCFSLIDAFDIAFAGPAIIKTTSTQLKTRCLL